MTRPSHRPPRLGQQRARRRSLFVTLLLSVASAGVLTAAVYLVTVFVPLLEPLPQSDPRFGPLNACAVGLGQPPDGAALSPDGQGLIAFAGSSFRVCGNGDAVQIELGPGTTVHAAALSGDGTPWISATRGGLRQFGPFSLDERRLRAEGELSVRALLGHPDGVVVLERSGKLYLLTPSGERQGYAELPSSVLGDAQLSLNAKGDLLALVAGGGFFVFRLPNLEPLRAEAPCPAEFLWWTADPERAVVACRGGLTLSLNAETGQTEALPEKRRARSVYVPGQKAFAEPCDRLFCTADPP